MKRLKPLRPIDVVCPFCWAVAGEPCYVGRRSDHRKEFHVDRRKAASPEEKP
jgi:hypothetical protein